MRPETMEPVTPLQDGMYRDKKQKILELAVSLRKSADALSSVVHPVVADSIGNLVRSMNCYYSNLIEGHSSHPVDIEKALKNDYSDEPKKRDLQKEAAAHIAVQKMIDKGSYTEDVSSGKFIKRIHKDFYDRLPDDLKWIEDKGNNERLFVEGGEYRSHHVQVGRHIAVPPELVPLFMDRFSRAYGISKLSSAEQIAAAAASHHRLLWIHPFLDGNGRTARLFSHAYLRAAGVGNSMWSVSRGLARTVEEYKKMLALADLERQGDYDGRSNLSLGGLQDFCIYFLKQCVDQAEFMHGLIRPHELYERIEAYCAFEASKGRMHPKAIRLLKEALFLGEFERGKAAIILDMSVSNASKVLNGLTAAELLVSDTPRGKVRLSFPYAVLSYWLPSIYSI